MRPQQTAEEVIQLRKATIVSQAAECGMSLFQGSFTLLKDRFISEEVGDQEQMVWSALLLFNDRI